MTIAPTPNRVEVTSRKIIQSGVLVFTPTSEVFYAQLGAPVGGSNLGSAKRRSTRPVGGGGSISPRWKFQTWLRYPEDAIVDEPPEPGSLLTIDGIPHEVSEDPSTLTQGTRVVGVELQVVGIHACYPSAVSIQDSAGHTVAEANISMWSPSESHDDRGERVDEQGEAPAAAYAFLSPRNTVVTVGDQEWRITKCTLDLDLGRVLLNLRNTRGAD